jgi:hypothetical protein
MYETYEYLILILEIVLIRNALSLGWKVKWINNKTIELTKPLEEINDPENFNLDQFLMVILHE